MQDEFATIDFTGYAQGLLITDQYEHLGALLTTGDDTLNGPSTNLYPNDDWGIQGNEKIIIRFNSPQHTIAASSPGFFEVWLYDDDSFVGASPIFFEGSDSVAFGGLISDVAFNRPIFSDFDDNVVFDDIYVGSHTPATGAAAFLGLAFGCSRLRRRHRRR